MSYKSIIYTYRHYDNEANSKITISQLKYIQENLPYKFNNLRIFHQLLYDICEFDANCKMQFNKKKK
jgi:hypothetical protein